MHTVLFPPRIKAKYSLVILITLGKSYDNFINKCFQGTFPHRPSDLLVRIPSPFPVLLFWYFLLAVESRRPLQTIVSSLALPCSLASAE